MIALDGAVSPKYVNKSGKLLQDGISGRGPGEAAVVAIVMLNELVDAGHQFSHVPEAAAADGLLGDETEQHSPGEP
jgi:hypothetical protein